MTKINRYLQWFIVAGAVLLLLLLIFVLSISADEFFSPNVASIVAHLGMSENVAVSGFTQSKPRSK